MRLKFIGANGSMGLIKGQIYKVTVKTMGKYIWVTWQDKFLLYVSCPYSSPQSFAENWEKI